MAARFKFLEDAYPIEEDSDQEHSDSSADDIDIILNGTPQQRKKLCRRSLGQDSSSEDEFEKEMAAKLNATMKKIEMQYGLTQCHSASANVKPHYNRGEKFDSSDEDESLEEKSKQPEPSNDDLLYDPDMDDDDQRWVNKQRQRYQPAVKCNLQTAAGSQAKRVAPLPSSDAVLNCPACMSQLCLDCQRHTVYHNQYRAMFVMNCTVRTDQILRYPHTPTQSKKRKGKRWHPSKSTKTDDAAVSAEVDADKVESEESYHPVVCTVCNSEVGVYDKDEVYHFFNVLASHA